MKMKTHRKTISQ